MLVVKAKIKEIVQAEGNFSVSSDFAEKLNEKVIELVKKACWRAKENNRRTVMPRDL